MQIFYSIAGIVVACHILFRLAVGIYVLTSEQFRFRQLISIAFMKRMAIFLIRGVINTFISIVTSTSFDFVIILSLFIFLWNFYCGIGAKVFILSEGNTESFLHIINPSAFQDAINRPDWLILCFPAIFFSLALIFHYNKEERKKAEEQGKKTKWLGFFGIIVFTLVLDATAAGIGLYIEHLERAKTRDYSGTFIENYWYYFLFILSCGFVTTFMFGMLLNYLRTHFKGSSSSDDELRSITDSNLEEFYE